MHQLPTEILYHVLGCLRRQEFDIDYHALRQSTLVCGERLPIARRYLFSQVSVRQGNPARDLTSFVEFLNAKPGLISAVETLRVYPNISSRAPLPVDDLLTALTLLSRIHHLNLSGNVLPSLPSDHAARLSIPSLTLSMMVVGWSTRVYGLSTTFSFLRFFANVGELCLHFATDRYQDDLNSILPSIPDLSGLEVSSLLLNSNIIARDMLLTVCQQAHLLDSLNKLDVSINTSSTAILLSEVLSAKLCAVRELTLSFNSARPLEVAENAPQMLQESIMAHLQPVLRVLHTLRTFRLLSRGTSLGSPFWEKTCPGLLSSLPPGIAAIHLYVDTRNFPLIKLHPSRPRCRVFPLEMAELEAALGRHEKLTDVYVYVTCPEELTRELPAMLAGSKRRLLDVLRFFTGIRRLVVRAICFDYSYGDWQNPTPSLSPPSSPSAL
ncbi:hypothetical protein PHLGIDRAFT_121825 [Phlebiopsis gigantea 11061_1 CR5-6]|uniref:Uncharacterized protein n=1 Tax=Phlebiopsis gigantea (strain 11061_1 CR5-6) TaxID=745531 RepID=A0A0C3PD51_PHLG1|nr:hypothetical protein PHLGIDRAFT_121825 [Phlebiopsis gigantea 11061_1 CR5-6]